MTLIIVLVMAIIQVITLTFVVVVLWDLILRVTVRRQDSRFEPTQRSVIEATLNALSIEPSDIVYDLGCGDGRFLFSAYRRERSATYIGIEYSRALYAYLLIRKLLAGNPRTLIFRRENFLDANLRDATKIYTFILPSSMTKLLPKCRLELRHTTLAAWCSPFPAEKAPYKTIELPYVDKKPRSLYLYRFDSRVPE